MPQNESTADYQAQHNTGQARLSDTDHLPDRDWDNTGQRSDEQITLVFRAGE